MDSLLRSVVATMERMEIRAGKQTELPETSNISPRGSVSSAPAQRGHGESNLVLDNRSSLLRRIKMPVFDGSQPYEWFSKVERFFRVGRYQDPDKLDLVALSLEGDVLKWFNWEMNRNEFRSWLDFRQRLVLRFGESIENDPGNRLFAIKQTGSVAAYVTEFEDLSAQVIGLDDSHLEKIFYNGLKQEMKEVLKMKEPRGLPNQKAAVLRMESSSFCQMIRERNTPGSTKTIQGRTGTSQVHTRPLFVPGVAAQAAPAVVPAKQMLQPRQRHTAEELDAMRSKSICFKCKGKYFRGHVCPLKELQILTVVNGLELEVLEEEFAAGVEVVEEMAPVLCCLSMNSFLGKHSPKTTKLQGVVNRSRVVVLIDSGASHNFVTPSLAAKLKLKLSQDTSMEVMLGNGVSVHGSGVCKDVKFSLAGVEFQGNFIALDLGGVDVILGVEWLETLGLCEVDWKSQVWRFYYKGIQVTLQGDPSLHYPSWSLKTLTVPIGEKQSDSQLLVLANNSVLPVDKQMDPAISTVLTSFSAVFTIPTGLPPVRGKEHSITLLPGVNSITVRPYRYPHSTKEVMEKMVSDMLASGIIQPSYYRKFVKGYGSLARPLTELLKKDKFLWSEVAQQAFDCLKQAMASVPVLGLPDFEKIFVLETDTSGTGVGAVLMQDKRPLAFFSHGLTTREQLKPAYERELMAIVMAVLKWRHYLMGRKFEVHTDQRILKFLLEQKEVHLEYQRWLTKLLGFDLEIVYKPGVENKAADGLSRIQHPISVALLALIVPSVIQLPELYTEIATDTHLQQLKSQVEAAGGSLGHYRVWEDRLWYKNRLVVPKASKFISLILTEYHDSRVGGHEGVLKTLKRIQQSFHWEGMQKDIQKYVSECVICQTHKYSTLSPAGLLQPLPIPTAIWEDISLDFIEGLPTSGSFNVILVVIDRLSKAAHFIGLKHPFKAIEVAQKFIAEVVRLHGFPKTIVSDRDRIFLGEVWSDMFRLAGTKLKYSTAYHPQTEGQTEVLNRCLETYLRCFASSHPKTWAKYLPWAEFSYNSSYHSAIKTTPFKMVYGRDAPQIVSFEKGSTTNWELEVQLRERDLMLSHIRANLQRAQDIMKKNADKKRREVVFQVDDWVYLKLQPYRQLSVARRTCHKLAAKFFGPFRVLERIGAVAYRLQLPDTTKIHNVFHVSQLKAVLGDLSQIPVCDPPEFMEDTFLSPEKIMEVRFNSTGGREFLVHWKDHSVADDSWVLSKDFVQAFPQFQLEDKLRFPDGSIDTIHQAYFRKKKETRQQQELGGDDDVENSGGERVFEEKE
ncbi:unnamed protein product [Arabidopsis halleri]